MIDLDDVDKKILTILHREGRLSNVALAERINLSPTPCLKRVKRLESNGVIAYYSAVTQPEKLGLGVSALALIELEKNTADWAREFEASAKEISEITDCYVTTGKHDYILKVYADSLPAYEMITKEKLGGLPHVSSIETIIILNQVISNGALPLPS